MLCIGLLTEMFVCVYEVSGCFPIVSQPGELRQEYEDQIIKVSLFSIYWAVVFLKVFLFAIMRESDVNALAFCPSGWVDINIIR